MVAVTTVLDTAERMRGFYPSSEEVRMARAIALSVVTEALMRGESRLSFRGFRFNAARILCAHEHDATVRVELVVALNGHIFDREIAEVLPLRFA